MAEFNPQAAQLRIRSAEAKLERIFRKAALDTFNQLLTEDLGSTKLVLTAATEWRPDHLARLLAIWRTKTGENLIPAVLSLYRTSAAQTLKVYPELAAALKALSPNYLDNIRNIRADAVLATLEPNIAGFGETAFVKVTSVLQSSLESGVALDKTQEAVRHALGVEVSRARSIARTMAGTAVNGADHAVFLEMSESGIDLKRQWLATSDTRTRPSHRRVNGKDADPETGGWMVGGAFLRYPGDPNGPADEVVQCRCTTILVPL